MKPKIKFSIPKPEKAAEFVYSLKENLGGTLGDAKERYENEAECIFIPLSKSLVERMILSKKLTPKLREELSKIITPILERKKEKLEGMIVKIERLWGEVGSSYWEEIENYFPGMFEKEYNAYLTNVVCGAYFGKNEVTIPLYKGENEKLFVYVMAEELLHLVYWKFLEKLFGKEKTEFMWKSGKKKWNAWNISEVIPEYILINNPKFQKLGWRKFDRTTHYPWLDDLKEILNPLWEKKTSFKDFVIKSYKVLGVL
ncbi:MAG: hypothetical protein NUV97_01245 [archaeon]|nr:hypothetical protein [archaeon]MCR4323412.1 hypothetical protein [Nanoarchaeota archaeon]